MTKVGMFEAKESESDPTCDLRPIYSGKIKERNCDWFADESDLWEEAN